jgi:hypothetical protein
VVIQVHPTKLGEFKDCFDIPAGFQQEWHNPISSAADKSVTDSELVEALVKSGLCYSLQYTRGHLKGKAFDQETASTDKFDPKMRLKALLDDVVQPWEKKFSGKSYEIRIWHEDPKHGLYNSALLDATMI